MADGPEFETCHHDNLNLPGAGCCEVISTLGLGPMESPKGLDMEFPGLKKKKKKNKEPGTSPSYSRTYFSYITSHYQYEEECS